MEFSYSLGGRTRVYPPSAAREDRYKFMSTGEAEPNLGVPILGFVPPISARWVLITDLSGGRYWTNSFFLSNLVLRNLAVLDELSVGVHFDFIPELFPPSTSLAVSGNTSMIGNLIISPTSGNNSAFFVVSGDQVSIGGKPDNIGDGNSTFAVSGFSFFDGSATITDTLCAPNIITRILSADELFVKSLTALSAIITVLDIKTFELSGYSIKGDLNVIGTVSATNAIIDTTFTNELTALTATFNHLTVKESLCSVGHTNVIDVSTNNPALRITQRGIGPSLLVEDSINPDSTPLVVNSLGQLIVGSLSAPFGDARQGIHTISNDLSLPRSNIQITKFGNSVLDPNGRLRFILSRGTLESPQIVQDGDDVGAIAWGAYTGEYGGSSSPIKFTSLIQSYIDGVPSLSSAPGKLVFSTSSEDEFNNSELYDRMIIDSFGRVGIGTLTPNEMLSLSENFSLSGNVILNALSGFIYGPFSNELDPKSRTYFQSNTPNTTATVVSFKPPIAGYKSQLDLYDNSDPSEGPNFSIGTIQGNIVDSLSSPTNFIKSYRRSDGYYHPVQFIFGDQINENYKTVVSILCSGKVGINIADPSVELHSIGETLLEGNLSATGLTFANTLVAHPTAAALITTRYVSASLDLFEPNLGVAPFDPLVGNTDFYVLTSNQYGVRGWAVNAKPYIYSGVQTQLSIQPALGENNIDSGSILSPFPEGSVISNGEKNEITYGLSFIGTGTENRISAANVTTLDGYNFIGNGFKNNIKVSIHSSILNGRNNFIETIEGYNTIINGRNHRIKTAFSNIFNGINNTIDFVNISSPELLETIIPTEYASVSDAELADSIKLFSKNVNGSNYLFVGSPYDDGGKVLIYKLIDDNITYIEKLSGEITGQFFGYDIDVDDENAQLYISSPKHNNLGSVYVYDINTTTDAFTVSYILSSENVDEDSRFGHSISVSPFNLIVGAPYDNLSAGSVHFYKRTDSSVQFSAYDLGLEILSGDGEEYFGYSVNSNIYTSQDSKLSGNVIVTAPNFSTDSKNAIGNFYLYSVSPSSDNFYLSRYYTASADYSETLNENSRLGDTRFIKSLYSNSRFEKGSSEFYVGAPNYQSNAQALSSSIGAIFRVLVNNEALEGLNVLFIPKYESSFAFTTASNMGYSIGSRKESNDLVKSWGVPSLSSNVNSGEVLYYDYDLLRYNSIKPANDLNHKLFGSSITDLTSSYKIVSYFNRSDNSPKIDIYTYESEPKASYSTINNGSNNRITGGENAYIALGNANTINTGTKNTAIFGNNNTIRPSLSNVFVFGSNLLGEFDNTTYVENLSVTRKLFVDEAKFNRAIIDDLTVTKLSAISATIDYLDIKFFELSGFDVKGNLSVTDTISSNNIISNEINTNYLSAVSATIDYLDIKYFEVSGFNVDGNLTVSNKLTATDAVFQNLSITTLSAVSAVFDVIDIKLYELSGFDVTGNVTVSGDLNVSNNISASGTIYTSNLEALSVKGFDLYSARLSTFATPLTANGDFLVLNINGLEKAIRLWDFQ